MPAYFYPLPTGSPWDDLTAVAGQVSILAIIDPSNSPGAQFDPNYFAAVNGLRAAGGQVIGYVDTSYATRPPSAVLADIDTYQKWYNLDGFFIDQMTADRSPAHLAYYQQIYDYVHNLNPYWFVVGNPGTTTDEAYLTQPTADILVLFENGTGYDSYTPPAWQASYPANQFAHLVYNVATAATMWTDVSLAASRNTGWVYVTDDNLPNPWDRLPSYWTDFLVAVSGCGPRTAPQSSNETHRRVALAEVTSFTMAAPAIDGQRVRDQASPRRDDPGCGLTQLTLTRSWTIGPLQGT